MASAGTAWRMAQFRPGSDPLRAMADALAQDGVLFRDFQAEGLTLAELVETTLRMSTLGLIDIYEQAQLGKDVNLLVVVDQFEELFRYRQLGSGEDEKVSGFSEEATASVNLLLEAKEQTTFPIYVVVTMRSDFLGDCAQFSGLAEAINAGQYLVPRMTRDERRAAISGPFRVGGAAISPVLLTRLVNDGGYNPDQLSILQHALNRTWSRWQNEGGGAGPLDLAHYQAIGTMSHALDQHAEKAYAELATARQQQICEKVFKALTDKATDLRGVRCPTKRGTLCAVVDATATEVTAVIDVFRQPSRSFLMPPAGEALEAETVIDISHESLMRVWGRLDRWADEEARSAWTYRRLAETAALHATGKASLYRDPELQIVLDWRDHNYPNKIWASRYQVGFSSAMDFLERSSAVREAERAKEEERLEVERKKELAEEGYGRRIGLAIITLMLLPVYMWLSHSLSSAADPMLERLSSIGRGPPLAAFESPSVLREKLPGDVGPVLVRLDERAGGASVITVRGGGLFLPGRPDITEPAQQVIAKIGEALNQFPGKIIVSAHADNVPVRSTNPRFTNTFRLTTARAESVASLLARKLFDKDRLEAEGRAGVEPVASNSTSEGRARNRRVEIMLFSSSSEDTH